MIFNTVLVPSKVTISIKPTWLCLMEHHLAFLPVTQAYSAQKCENQGIFISLIYKLWYTTVVTCKLKQLMYC